MMQEEMVINGEKYVRKETGRFDLPCDDANVMGILALKDHGDSEILTPRSGGGLSFKYSCKLDDFTTKLGSDKATSPNSTIVSLEYVAKAKAIEKLLSYSKFSFEAWESVDATGKFEPNKPIMLVHGRRGYIIAPRVEDEIGGRT